MQVNKRQQAWIDRGHVLTLIIKEDFYYKKRRDTMSSPDEMWRCQTVNCGYVYDPARGDRKHKIPPGTKFEDLPDDWRCPVCNATKKSFKRLTDE